MARQAGIVDALHSRGTLEAPGQLGRRLPVALHADRQRLDAAQHQVAVHRTRHGADRVLQEGELLRQLWIAGDERAAHYVGVAVDVLGGGVQHDGRAQREGPLQGRRGEGVVHDQRDLPRPDQIGGGTDVDQPEERVGRRLEPDHARAPGERPFEMRGIAQVDEARLDAERAQDLLEEPVRAAVHVVAADDVVAGTERVEEGRRRRTAAREGEGAGAALEGGQARLERRARRVAAARVVEAQGLPRLRLREGRRQDDRLHHRAADRIGLLPGVHGQRLERRRVRHGRSLGEPRPRVKQVREGDPAGTFVPIATAALLAGCRSVSTSRIYGGAGGRPS